MVSAGMSLTPRRRRRPSRAIACGLAIVLAASPFTASAGLLDNLLTKPGGLVGGVIANLGKLLPLGLITKLSPDHAALLDDVGVTQRLRTSVSYAPGADAGALARRSRGSLIADCRQLRMAVIDYERLTLLETVVDLISDPRVVNVAANRAVSLLAQPADSHVRTTTGARDV